MGQVKKIDFILVTLLLVFTTFEYFFREPMLTTALCGFCLIWGGTHRVRLVKQCAVLFFLIFVALLMQLLYKEVMIKFYTPLNIILQLMGVYCLAWVTREDFFRIFVKLMTVIAAYCTVLYLLFLNDTIFYWVYDNITPYFTSLKVDTAVFEGGGRNIIIYNLQTDQILERVGFRRCCGPFWEPGQYALFLGMALFCNMVLGKGSQRVNTLFLVAMITTLSTAGLIVLPIIYLCRISQGKLTVSKVVGLILLTVVVGYMAQMEFVGAKVVEQINHFEKGNDDSRFGAFFTQLDMIADYPWFGGADLANYAKTSKTLASGLLLPMVNYGILAGVFIYYSYFIASRNIAAFFRKGKVQGVALFLFIMINSFPQTILLTPFFICILFLGLIYGNKLYTASKVSLPKNVKLQRRYAAF